MSNVVNVELLDLSWRNCIGKPGGRVFYFEKIYINHRAFEDWLLLFSFQDAGISSLSVLAPGSMCVIYYYEYFLQIYWVLYYAWCSCPTAIYLWFCILGALLGPVRVQERQSLMRWYAIAILGWYYLHITLCFTWLQVLG